MACEKTYDILNLYFTLHTIKISKIVATFPKWQIYQNTKLMAAD